MSKNKMAGPLELGALEMVYSRTRLMALVLLGSIAGILAVVVAINSAP